jgi:hypothetical protein
MIVLQAHNMDVEGIEHGIFWDGDVDHSDLWV